jgi:hypothetical protein
VALRHRRRVCRPAVHDDPIPAAGQNKPDHRDDKPDDTRQYQDIADEMPIYGRSRKTRTQSDREPKNRADDDEQNRATNGHGCLLKPMTKL